MTKHLVKSPLTPDMAAAVDLVADVCQETVTVEEATTTAPASSFTARRHRKARPADGTSKLTADDYVAEYLRQYREKHPERVLRWRITAARNLLLRMGARITWPAGDPTATDSATRITTTTDAPPKSATPERSLKGGADA